jgi:hypothetical protein
MVIQTFVELQLKQLSQDVISASIDGHNRKDESVWNISQMTFSEVTFKTAK